MLPQTYFFRHDEVITVRPFACDADEQGWLWEGVGLDLLGGHNLRTGEHRVIRVPEMGNNYVFQALVCGPKLVCTLGMAHHYVVYDLDRGTAVRKELPGHNPIVWYGSRTPQGKLLLFERTNNKILVLDEPEADPRVIDSPYPGQLVVGDAGSDGLMYMPVYEPSLLLRFDPAREKFVDRIEFPEPESAYTGTYGSSLEIDGVRYFANNTTGALQPLEMGSLRWREPIPTPGWGTVYGWITTAFTCQGKAYFLISTLKRPTRLDPKQGMKLDVSGLFNTTDGLFLRFLGAHLVFEAKTGRFDYLRAPEQPDGVPLLCYWWTDGRQFAITGIIIPYNRRGTHGREEGPWIIVQSEPAREERGLGPYDTTFTDVTGTREAYARGRRGDYPSNLPLYIAREGEALPEGVVRPGVAYAPGKVNELVRRRSKSDAAAYWRDLAERLRVYRVGGNPERLEDAAFVKRVGGFVQKALLHHPVQAPAGEDPIVALEAHEGRVDDFVAVTLELLRAAGIEARRVELRDGYAVAEAFYDGGWHIVDALAFGYFQPTRDGLPPLPEELRVDPSLAWQTKFDEPNIYLGRPSYARAGRVLSVDELRADPYFADGFPTPNFAIDPAWLASQDGFQVLGDMLGPWGTRPYYSYFLGGDEEYPPTMPAVLPATRLDGRRLRLRWSESAKRPSSTGIEYDVRVCADRDCLEPRQQTVTAQTHWEVELPANRLCYVEVRAVDVLRARNSLTWHPAARWNVILDDPRRKGWHGWV